MKTCPACKTQIHSDAARCPACQIDFTDDQMTAGQQETKGNRTLLIVIGLVVAVAALSWLDGGGAERLGELSAEAEVGG